MKLKGKNDESSLVIKDKIDVDSIIKVAHFKKEIRKTVPHRHNNYFEIIYLSKGSGSHLIDSRKFEICPPIIFFIRQEQVHHWDIAEEPEGFVIIIKKAFIDHSIDNELKALISSISRQNCLLINEHSTIEQLFTLLLNEYKLTTTNGLNITEGLLKALMSKILDVSNPITDKQENQPNLYSSFIDLLYSEPVVKNNVAYYADLLNTSPQNVNSACRKTADKSATEVLADFILAEAKRLLIYTRKSVSEISFELEFNDPSHFVKFFKRHSGQTPAHFRSIL